MPYKPLYSWPPVSRQAELILELKPKFLLGNDLEWSIKTGQPTILGLSDGTLTVSCSFDDGINFFNEVFKRHPFAELVGHNLVSADLMVLRNLGISIPLERVQDTIIWHWLVNMHLCKTTKKAGLEEDAGEKRGRGFMNLGTMLSLYTDLPYYKECRGEGECSGPCPAHDVFGYNGIDSLGPVIALPKLRTTAKLRRVDHLYPMHRELAMVLAEWSERGLKIDTEYVANLREDFLRQKTAMREELPFNPESPKQVKEFFSARGIELKDSREDTIRDMVEEYPDDEFLDQFLLYKEVGDGPDRWFLPKEWVTKNAQGKPCSPHWAGFVDENGYVHPRLGFYTSSGRLMCADPNFQNVPKRRLDRRNCVCGHTIKEHAGKCSGTGCECKKFTGINLGKKLRRAVIAPEGHYIVRADYSNGENRVYLYLAGYAPPKEDLHSWMVQNIGIDDSHPFAVKMGSARDAAKSVTHACLTGDHEILTPWGWRRIDKYAGGPIACWQPDGKIIFEKPLEKFSFPFSGELDCFSGRGLSSVHTPNHAFPVFVRGYDSVYKRQYQKFHRLQSCEMKKSGRIPVSGKLAGSVENYSNLVVRRGIAIQADATARSAKMFEFHVVKEHKKRRIEQLFGVQGKPCGCHTGGMRYSVRYRSDFLSEKKEFTCAVLLLTPAQRELFLAEVLLWDGSTKDKHGASCYRSTSYDSARYVQTVAHLSGKQALMRCQRGTRGRKDCWHVSFNRRRFAAVNRLEITKQPFVGEVHCFRTTTGYFFTRHNNRISITGNSDYGEGLQLKTLSELRTPGIRREIDRGARIVCSDWTFEGKIVTFTGANLAQRAFGSKTLEHRRMALEIQERYIGKFEGIRALQKRITKQIEKEKIVRPPHGYALLNYGRAEDRIKQALAVWGSQPVAHISKLAILNVDRHWKAGRPVDGRLQIHDELLAYAKESVDPRQAAAWLREDMEIETPEMPGFVLPSEASYGPDWSNQTKLK